MAEAAAIIGLVSSIASLVELSTKVVSRLHEFTSKTSEIPESFHSLSMRLPLLTETLQRIQTQAGTGHLPDDVTKALKAVVDNTSEQVSAIQTYLSKILPPDGASKLERALKALKSLAKEDKVQQALERIRRNNEILVLHQTTRHVDKGDQILEMLSKLRMAPPEPSKSSGTRLDQASQIAPDVCVGQTSSSQHLQDWSAIVVPFERDSDFVGREDLIQRIDQALSTSSGLRRVALEGLGGVGKSQIAIEYGYRVRAKSPQMSVFWVHASNVVRFEQSYRNIAYAAKLPVLEEQSTDVLGRVHRWLESEESGDWLMVLDNADDAANFSPSARALSTNDHEPRAVNLSAYLPRNTRGAILVTSRSRDTALRLAGKQDQVIKVEKMNEQEAKTLLDKKLPHDTSIEGDWNALTQVLEYLPLAITQAAAYITMKAPRITVSKYLAYFRQSEKMQSSLLSRDGGDLRRDSDVPNAVVVTWQISFDQIKSQDPAAAHLLSCMSVLDRQGVPAFLFYDNDEERLAFDDAVGTLVSFSFVAVEKDEEAYVMHRLVQLSMRKWLEMQGEMALTKEDTLQTLASKYPNGDHSNWKICESLEPHAETLFRYEYISTECKLNLADLMHNGAWYMWAQGKYQIAESRVKAAFEIKKSLLGLQNTDTAASLSLFALVLRDQGKYEQAEEIHREVLRLSERVLGKEHPNTLSSMNKLAEVLRDQGKYEQAEEIHREVLRLSERVLGKEHPNTLMSMNNLAEVFRDQGKYEQAEEIHREVLRLSERVLGKEHPDTLTSMNNLARVLRDQGKYEQAEEIHREVLRLIERVLGKEHPNTLTSMNNLALVLWSQDRLKEAEEFENRVVETSIRLLGSEHPATLISMNNLAHTWKSLGRDEDAIDLMNEVTRLRGDKLGDDHPRTIGSAETLNSWLAAMETGEATASTASEEVLPSTNDDQISDHDGPVG